MALAFTPDPTTAQHLAQLLEQSLSTDSAVQRSTLDQLNAIEVSGLCCHLAYVSRLSSCSSTALLSASALQAVSARLPEASLGETRVVAPSHCFF